MIGTKYIGVGLFLNEKCIIAIIHYPITHLYQIQQSMSKYSDKSLPNKLV